MGFDPPLGHEALLTLARKVTAAAADGDRERLEPAALHLFDALIEHVGAERPDLVRLPPGERRQLVHGQQRVIDLIVRLALDAATPGPCRCAPRAQQLLAELTLQAGDERLSLAATNARRGPVA